MCSAHHKVPLQEPAHVHVPLHVHLQLLLCYLNWSSIVEKGSHRRIIILLHGSQYSRHAFGISLAQLRKEPETVYKEL